MGYTHYWSHVKDFTEPFVEGVRAILAKTEVPISLEFDEVDEKPIVTNGEIFLNGQGDDGHETFYLFAGPEFHFCKTARKPYDTVVVAILALADHYSLVSVSSDGNADDWREGLELACLATGLTIQCPDSVHGSEEYNDSDAQ